MAVCASALFLSFFIFLDPRYSSGTLAVTTEGGGSWSEGQAGDEHYWTALHRYKLTITM